MTKFIPVAEVAACKAEQGQCVSAGDKEIALFRIGDEFYAIANECPHYGAALCDGYLDDKVVSCPWHGWEFSLETGESPLSANIRVASYPVRIENGVVQVGIEEEAAEG